MTAVAQGRTKFENEYRLKEQAVPEKAAAFIAAGPFERKIRWYAENSQDGATFEAKTRHEGIKYSIEFDSVGNLLDVERRVDFDELAADVQENINKSLEEQFSRHRVKKTQIQWKGDRATLLELVNGRPASGTYNVFYELVLKARKENWTDFYEVLLDGDGRVREVARIVQRSTNNLEF